MKLTVGTKQEYELPVGLVQGVLMHVSDVGELEFKDEKTGKVKKNRSYVLTFQLKTQYKTAQGDLKNMLIERFFNETLNPLSKLYKVVSGMLGRELSPTDECDIGPDVLTCGEEKLIGKNCMLFLVKGKARIEIDKVMPLPVNMEAMVAQDIPVSPWIINFKQKV